MSNVLAFNFDFVTNVTCCNCGVAIVMPQWYRQKRIEDHATFYCLNGHAQSYTGKSDAEKLREELERERRYHAHTKEREASLRAARNTLEHRLNGTKGALTKIKKRVCKGVCPACNRTFQDLARHMESKHEGYGVEK